MADVNTYLEESAVPSTQSYELLDARELPPPQPLRKTLETLAELDDSMTVVQLNDRAPMHLYPKLEDRGYQHETIEDGETVVTIIWEDIAGSSAETVSVRRLSHTKRYRDLQPGQAEAVHATISEFRRELL